MDTTFLKTLFYRYTSNLSNLFSGASLSQGNKGFLGMIGNILHMGALFFWTISLSPNKDVSAFFHRHEFALTLSSLWILGDALFACLTIGTYGYQSIKAKKLLNFNEVDQLLAGKLSYVKKGKCFLMTIVFFIGFLAGFTACVMGYFLIKIPMTICLFLFNLPKVLFKMIRSLPQRMQEKNKAYLENNPEIASKILKEKLHQNLPQSTLKPSKNRL